MKTLSNIRFVLGFRNYFFLFLLLTVLFWILFGYLLGLENLPWLDWNAFSNSVVWELFLPNLVFVLIAGTLNALLLTLTVFRLKELQGKISGKESKSGLLGVGLTSVFAACPFCAVSVASVFGISFVANVIAPFYLEFQLLALAIVLVSLYWTAKKLGTECEACNVKVPN